MANEEALMRQVRHTTAGRIPWGWRMLVVGVLVGVTALLGGCKIDVALDTTIETDGSGTLGIYLAVDKALLDLVATQGGGADLFGEFEKQVPQDWTLERGTDPEGGKWVKASTPFASPEELDQLLAGEAEGSLGEAFSGGTFHFTQEKGLLSTYTVFDAAWDAGKTVEGAGGLPEGISMDMLQGVFQVQNRVTFPGSIKENNATEVDGDTLIWAPSLTGVTTMHAESRALNWTIVGALIGVGAVAIAIVVVVVVLLWVRRRRSGTPASEPVAEPAPAEPVAAEPALREPVVAGPASAEQVATGSAATDAPEAAPALPDSPAGDLGPEETHEE